MTKATRTAICMDANGNPVPVHCKLWTNWHGATNLQKTKERLAKDHPDLTFHGWVYDLDDHQDRNSLRLNFLSPNVVSRLTWVKVHDEISLISVTPEMVA